MNNYNFVQASLAEFLNVWSTGGDASLNLTTTGGRVNMAFNVSLGNPGSAFSSPSSSVRHQRHRGPADKEKSRQRAAAHQAAAAVGEPKSAAGHQETLGRATSPPVSDPPISSCLTSQATSLHTNSINHCSSDDSHLCFCDCQVRETI